MTQPATSYPSETPALLQDRVETSGHYYENALKLLARGEDRKASELLWGAATQFLKAMALLEGKDLRTHGAIKSWVNGNLGVGRSDLAKAFRRIESLHSNFYDRRLDHDEVEELAGTVSAFIEELRRLLYETMTPPGGVELPGEGRPAEFRRGGKDDTTSAG